MLDADQLGHDGHVRARASTCPRTARRSTPSVENPPGQHFLGTAHTLANFETAFYRSDTADNSSFEQWPEDGGLDAAQRANRLWKQRLAAYEPPPHRRGDRRGADSSFIARRKAVLPDLRSLLEFLATRNGDLLDVPQAGPVSVAVIRTTVVKSLPQRLKLSRGVGSDQASWPFGSSDEGPSRRRDPRVARGRHFEVVPRSRRRGDRRVRRGRSVTCSPAKGIPATSTSPSGCSTSATIRPAHLGTAGRRCRRRVQDRGVAPEHGLRDLFVVGGDAEQPQVRTPTARVPSRLLAHDPGSNVSAVPAYPDGHPFIDRSLLLGDAAHAKQALITEAGVAPGIHPDVLRPRSIRSWLQEERSDGP